MDIIDLLSEEVGVPRSTFDGILSNMAILMCIFVFAIIIFSRYFSKEFQMQRRSVHVLFAFTFALSIKLLLLTIYEMADLFSPKSRTVFWQFVLGSLVIMLVVVLPTATVSYLCRALGLRSNIVILFTVIGDLLFIFLFWRAGYAFPSITRKEMGVFTMEGFVSRLGVSGVTIASVLGGFGAIGTPANLVINVIPSLYPINANTIVSLKRNVRSAWDNVIALQREKAHLEEQVKTILMYQSKLRAYRSRRRSVAYSYSIPDPFHRAFEAISSITQSKPYTQSQSQRPSFQAPGTGAEAGLRPHSLPSSRIDSDPNASTTASDTRDSAAAVTGWSGSRRASASFSHPYTYSSTPNTGVGGVMNDGNGGSDSENEEKFRIELAMRELPRLTDVLIRLRRLVKDEENVLTVHKELVEEYHDALLLQENSAYFQTPRGRLWLLVLITWSVANVLQICNRFLSLFLHRGPNERDLITRMSEFVLVQGLGMSPDVASVLTLPLSFAYVGILVFASVRGFLINFSKLLKKVSGRRRDGFEHLRRRGRKYVRWLDETLRREEERRPKPEKLARYNPSASIASTNTSFAAVPASQHGIPAPLTDYRVQSYVDQLYGSETDVSSQSQRRPFQKPLYPSQFSVQQTEPIPPSTSQPVQHFASLEEYLGKPSSLQPPLVTSQQNSSEQPSSTAGASSLPYNPTSQAAIRYRGSTITAPVSSTAPSTSTYSSGRMDDDSFEPVDATFGIVPDTVSAYIGTVADKPHQHLQPYHHQNPQIDQPSVSCTTSRRVGRSPMPLTVTPPPNPDGPVDDQNSTKIDISSTPLGARSARDSPHRQNIAGEEEMDDEEEEPDELFLENLYTVNRVSTQSTLLSSFLVLSFALVTGMYFISSVILLRMSVPMHLRKGITKAIGEVPFPFFHKWSDVVFVISASVAVVAELMTASIKSSRRLHTEEQALLSPRQKRD